MSFTLEANCRYLGFEGGISPKKLRKTTSFEDFQETIQSPIYSTKMDAKTFFAVKFL